MMKKFGVTLAVAAIAMNSGIGSAKADINVGVAGPITGSVAAFGEEMKRGFEKAVADINAKGGLLGQKLVPMTGDDACDAKQAVSVANDFASKKVVAVFGHFCSSTSIPASDVYNESGIIEISPGSTNPLLTERKLPNIFRVCGRDDAQGPTAADYVVSHFKGKKVAIVDDKSTYGKGLADEFKKELNAKGVTEVLHDQITAGDKDFSPLVTKLKQAGADIIYFGGYHPEAALIVRQSRDQGVNALLMGGDALDDSAYWSITGAVGEGTMMTFGPDAMLDPKNAELVAWFRSQKYEPEAYTLYTYAAVQAWAQAVAKAGSTDASKVEAALRTNKFDTALGNIGFDAKGDVTAPGYVMYEWKNGKAVYAAK